MILHVVALAALTSFAAFMAQHAIAEFRTTLAFGSVTNTPLQTPLWVPQICWVIGTCFFMVVALAMTVDGALLIAAGRGATVDGLYGPLTVDDELDDYRQDLSATPSPARKES